MRWSACSVALGLVLLGTAPSVRADTCREDPGGCAARFFEAGRKLLDAGDLQGAIPIFRKSLDQRPTIGAHLNLGDCLDKTGAPWDAYVQYQAAARLAAQLQDGRRQAASASASALESKVLRVRLVDDPVAGRVVELDGVVVPPEELALLHDGTYGVDASKKHSVLVRSERGLVFRGVLEGAPGEARELTVSIESPRPVAPPGVDERLLPLAAAPPSVPTSGQRTAGIVIAGAGLAGVAVGAVFGFVAVGDSNQVHRLCEAGGGSYAGTCKGDPSQVDSANDAANRAALVSTVGLAAGAVVLATGVTVYLLSPRAGTVRVAPTVGKGSTGLVLQGAW